jgi:hypothetical protein
MAIKAEAAKSASSREGFLPLKLKCFGFGDSSVIVMWFPCFALFSSVSSPPIPTKQSRNMSGMFTLSPSALALVRIPAPPAPPRTLLALGFFGVELVELVELELVELELVELELVEPFINERGAAAGGALVLVLPFLRRFVVAVLVLVLVLAFTLLLALGLGLAFVVLVDSISFLVDFPVVCVGIT